MTPLAVDVPLGYRIERVIGSGSEATVYLARDLYIDRAVTLKGLPLVDMDRDLLRVRKAAGIAASIVHPNVTPLFSVVPGRHHLWLVGGYAPGKDLAAVIAAGALTPNQVSPVLREVVSALEAVHNAGCIHNDLSAANVIITGCGGVRLTDFGTACRIGDDLAYGGTPGYIAPEKHSSPIALPSIDLFSLGALMNEMLTAARISRRALSSSVMAGASSRGERETLQALEELGVALTRRDPKQRPSLSTAKEVLWSGSNRAVRGARSAVMGTRARSDARNAPQALRTIIPRAGSSRAPVRESC